MFKIQAEKAKGSVASIRKNMDAMGKPDLLNIKDKDHLAAYMMLYITARIYENANTNHFGGKEGYGHVGAVGIIPGIDEIVFFQSKKKGRRWIHAERGVWKKMRHVAKRHGLKKLPRNCILIVSMEPCVGDVPGRIGCCCSDLVKDKRFAEVFVGYRDWTLGEKSGKMPQWPSNWKLITDGYVRQVAKELYDFFGDWYISRMAP